MTNEELAELERLLEQTSAREAKLAREAEALRAENARLREALDFCQSEAARANEILRQRFGRLEGQARIGVANALHRIENIPKYHARAALEQGDVK